MMNIDIGALFLAALRYVSNSITALLDMLPNPDPFPEVIDAMQVSTGDPLAIAFYWVDQFFIADAIVAVLGTWFLMFPLAWIIMMLWRWIKTV